MYELLSQTNLVVTLILVGLIWTIQLVHYPSFHYVQPDEFIAFERMHTLRITVIVVPLMICELAVSGWLAFSSGYALNQMIVLVIVVLVWLSTFVLSVPCHRKLATGKDDKTITRLVNTNWVRTVLWTAKGVLLCVW